MAQKTCFVISPIGDKGTPIRRQADCVLEYIIKPALTDLDYDEPIRVDRLDNPTHITTEIIQHLINADMVITDLSGSNPNVFYELGIRHAFQKPCIMLSDWDKKPPFDVSGINIIQYVHDDPTSHVEAAKRIKGQIEKLNGGVAVSNPVTVANGFSRLETSGDDRDQIVAKLVMQVDKLTSKMSIFEHPRDSGIGTFKYEGQPVTSAGSVWKQLPYIRDNEAQILELLRSFQEGPKDKPDEEDQ